VSERESEREKEREGGREGGRDVGGEQVALFFVLFFFLSNIGLLGIVHAVSTSPLPPSHQHIDADAGINR
jgi:hypothetical protein